MLARYKRLNNNERTEFMKKAFIIDPSQIDESCDIRGDEEYETDSSYLHIDTDKKIYLNKYKSYNLNAGYFSDYWTAVKRKQPSDFSSDLRTINFVLFEIDVDRNNLYGLSEIKDDGLLHYRLFDNNDEGFDFALDDLVTELKFTDDVLYAVTGSYYYTIYDNIKTSR
jgi:hypothetical protein